MAEAFVSAGSRPRRRHGAFVTSMRRRGGSDARRRGVRNQGVAPRMIETSGSDVFYVRNDRRPRRSKAAAISLAQGQAASRRRMRRRPVATRRPAACQTQ